MGLCLTAKSMLKKKKKKSNLQLLLKIKAYKSKLKHIGNAIKFSYIEH